MPRLGWRSAIVLLALFGGVVPSGAALGQVIGADPSVAPGAAAEEPQADDPQRAALRVAAARQAQEEERLYILEISRQIAEAKGSPKRQAELEKLFPTGSGGYAGGGDPVNDRGAPFQVQIGYAPQVTASAIGFTPAPGQQTWDWKHICGGVLIARDWVLTAAHCASKGQFDVGIAARLGAEDLASPNDMIVRIDRVIRHRNYVMGAKPHYDDDIALMHLAKDPRPRNSAQIAAIIVNSDPALEQRISAAAVTGWGKSFDSGGSHMRQLQRINVSLMPQKDCQALDGYGSRKVHERVICARANAVKSCSGDSGGPLFAPGHGRDLPPLLLGIVSWNNGGCVERTAPRPGIYTRVSKYVRWIGQAMQSRASDGAFQLLGPVRETGR